MNVVSAILMAFMRSAGLTFRTVWIMWLDALIFMGFPRWSVSTEVLLSHALVLVSSVLLCWCVSHSKAILG